MAKAPKTAITPTREEDYPEWYQEVIKAAEVLFEQYLAWLSWGFDDNWKPSLS